MGSRAALDCILDTSLSWAEFENALRASLGTNARFGDNKTVLDIGDGTGFTSRCGLVTCDWNGAATEEKLPARVVINIPSAPMLQLNNSLPAGQRQFEGEEEMWREMEQGLKEIHNIEVATYEFFKDFEGLSIPKLYYGVPCDVKDKIDGQICLEYVENSRMMSFYEHHTVEQVRQIARAMGKIHACSLKKEVNSPQLHCDFYERFYTNRTKAYSGMLKSIFTLDQSEKTKELMSNIETVLPDYHDTNLLVTLHKQMGFRPVLVNGDLRTENVLLDKDSGDLAALIDWQCTHLGVGVEDLHRITLFALTAEDRRASTPMLVEEMYNGLVENLNGEEPPYSLDEFLLLSDLLFPHCALFFAAGCVSLITNHCNATQRSDEAKPERTKVALSKVVGALEDVLNLHDKNKKHPVTLRFRNP